MRRFKQRRRFAPVAAVFLIGGLAGGCLAPRSDLSEPRSWTEFQGEDVVIRRGDDLLPVIAEDSAENRWAALFLAQTIADVCGRRPDVLVTRRGERQTAERALFVGGEDASFTGEAFRVVARNGSVRFLGRADYAVFDWCERMLGLRFYCRNGKCVDRRDTIVVPAVDYSDAPVFARRLIGGNTPWCRVSKGGNAHRGGTSVHAPHGWYRDARLRKEHPAIFESGRTPMLCYGNPETLACYKDRIDRHISGLGDSGGIVDTNRMVVTVCPWDAPIVCDCRHCRALKATDGDWSGTASPIVWQDFTAKLSEWLAAAHPDYMISFLPYLNFCSVPHGLLDGSSPHRLVNAEAEVCTMPGLALLKNDACRDREERLLRDWKKATGRKIINWHYGCWPRDRTSAPYVFGHTVRRHYEAMRDVTDGSFVCANADDPSIALSLYVWARCLWNPSVDVEAIYDGFATRMFGAGAEPMRELIALQEKCWNRQWEDNACSYHNIYEVSFTADDVRRMKALLKDAYRRTLLANDEKATDRIRWYADAMTRFFEEEPLARRALADPTNGCEMVAARDAANQRPWARTTVRTAMTRNTLEFTVRCEEPAVAALDFSTHSDDIIRGDDSLTFVVRENERTRTAKVFRDGTIRGTLPISVGITHDATGWTVTARLALSPSADRSSLCGNVSRWRVGDMRLPADRRVKGSRYEHSRIKTRLTYPDDDPAAFVALPLRKQDAPAP